MTHRKNDGLRGADSGYTKCLFFCIIEGCVKEAGNHVDAASLDFATGSYSVVRMQKSHQVLEELTIFWAK
jgi:hypothetical protein